MSAQNVYPGQGFLHTLVPLKGWYRESALDAAGYLTSDVNINSNNSPAVSGLVVHGEDIVAKTDPYSGLTTGGPGTLGFEMGCGPGDGLPMTLWSGPGEPDVSNPGVIPGVPNYGTTSYPPDFGTALPRMSYQNLVALVHTGAYEIETTEFDTDQTYTGGQALRAVTSNTNANAGKVTNQNGGTVGFHSGGAVAYVATTSTVTNWDTIVGFVSRGKYKNANKRYALAYYTDFVPGNR